MVCILILLQYKLKLNNANHTNNVATCKQVFYLWCVHYIIFCEVYVQIICWII